MNDMTDKNTDHIYSKKELIQQKESISDTLGFSDKHTKNIDELVKDSVTPNAPDRLNIDTAHSFEPMIKSGLGKGASHRSTWYAKNKFGDHIQIKFDTISGRAPVQGGKGWKVFKEMYINEFENICMPEIYVDTIRNATVLEYIYNTKSLTHGDNAHVNTEINEKDFYNIVAIRSLMGDRDIIENTIVKPDGTIYMIDLEMLGENASKEFIKKQLLIVGAEMYDINIGWEEIEQKVDNSEVNSVNEYIKQSLNDENRDMEDIDDRIGHSIELSVEKALESVDDILKMIDLEKFSEELSNNGVDDWRIQQIFSNANAIQS